MGMDLRTAPSKFILGDYVGAMDRRLVHTWPVFGRVSEIRDDDGRYMVTTATKDVTGPWREKDLWHDPSHHVDYPHHPGTLYDCPACEVLMEEEDDR